MRKSLKSIVATGIMAGVLGSALLTGCTPVQNTRGAFLQPHDLERVNVGTSTKQEVVRALGTPSTVSSFYDDTWYYVGNRTEKLAFFDPEIVEHQVVEAKFDDQQVLTALNLYDEDDLRKIEPVDRETPTAGKELTALQQVIGNIGKFNKGK